jgi:hypothetical protein
VRGAGGVREAMATAALAEATLGLGAGGVRGSGAARTPAEEAEAALEAAVEESDLLRYLSRDGRAALAAAMAPREVAEGEVLYDSGEVRSPRISPAPRVHLACIYTAPRRTSSAPCVISRASLTPLRWARPRT